MTGDGYQFVTNTPPAKKKGNEEIKQNMVTPADKTILFLSSQRTGRHLRILWDDIQSLITDTVVLPNSRFAKLWELLVLLVTLVIAFLYPYCASFIGMLLQGYYILVLLFFFFSLFFFRVG